MEKTNTVATGWSDNSRQQGPKSAAQWMNINWEEALWNS